MLRSSAIAALVAVGLGTASLIVVLALMSGYADALQKGVLTASGHLIVWLPNHDPKDLLAAAAQLKTVNGVQEVNEVIYQPALIFKGDDLEGELVSLRGGGISSTFFKAHPAFVKSGPLPVQIGRTLAKRLSCQSGDQLVMQVVVEGRSRSITTKVLEVFATGFPDIDERLVVTDMPSLRNRVSGLSAASLEVRLDDPQTAEEYKFRLAQVLSGTSYISSWQDTNPDYFAALRWQKLSLAVVFSLILGVGAFEVASSLVVMVTEKRRELGVLSAMGGGRSLILQVLVLAGGALGCLGVIVGTVGGVVVVLVLNALGIPHFPPEIASIYRLDHIPLLLLPLDVLLVLGLGVAEVLLASLLPARRASMREPVEVLRWV